MIIDTNFYSALDRGDAVSVDVVKANKDSNILIPLQVIAELLYGFAKGNKNEENISNLQKFISMPRVKLCAADYDTAEYYAEIQLHCVQAGRVLSNNDVWIAALAYQHREKLATFDKDFEIMRSFLGDDLILLTK